MVLGAFYRYVLLYTHRDLLEIVVEINNKGAVVIPSFSTRAEGRTVFSFTIIFNRTVTEDILDWRYSGDKRYPMDLLHRIYQEYRLVIGLPEDVR